MSPVSTPSTGRRFLAAVASLAVAVGVVAVAPSAVAAPAKKTVLCLGKGSAPVLKTEGGCRSGAIEIALTKAESSALMSTKGTKALCVDVKSRDVRVISAKSKCGAGERKIKLHNSPKTKRNASETKLIAVPSAFANLSVATDASTATVTASGADDGGSPITGIEYRLERANGGTWSDWIAVPASPFTLSGLTTCAYAIEARAVNALGEGVVTGPVSFALKSDNPCSSAVATPRAPAVPAAVSVSAETLGDASVTAHVTATPGDAGTSGITGYQYMLSTDGGHSFGDWVTAPQSATGKFDIADLDPGSAYALRVRAVNAVGAGLSSADTDFSVPAISSFTVAASGLTSAAPSVVVNGGTVTVAIPSESVTPSASTVTGYQWRWSAVGTSTWSNAIDAGASGTFPIVIPGLSLGTNYLIEVRGVSASGIGPWSGSQTLVTAVAPGKPVLTNVTRGASGWGPAYRTGSFSISYPAGNGGAPIDSVEVAISDVETIVFNATTTSDHYCRDGYTYCYEGYVYSSYDGQHTVKVRAHNAAGWSAWSDNWALAWNPSAPTLGAVTPDATSVSVAVTAPTSNGGATVTGYDFALSTDGGTTWSTVTSASTATPFSLTGLTESTNYLVRVRAKNSAGYASDWVTSSTFRTLGVPAAPSITSATVNGTTASVSFTAGASGGFAISGYSYELSSNGSTVSGSPVAVSGTSSPVSVTGLASTGSTWVRLAAVNSRGTGPWSPWFEIAVTSAATGLTATFSNSNPAQPVINASWGAVAGATGYEVRWATSAYDSSTPGAYGTAVATNSTSYSIPATLGTKYYVEVRATGANGPSVWSSAVTASALGSLGALTINSVSLKTQGGGQRYDLTSNWSLAATGGYRVTSQSMSWGNCAGSGVGTNGAAASGSAGSVTAYSYSAPSNYPCVSVTVNTASGPSASASIRLAAPAAPSNLTATVTGTSAVIGFTAPAAVTPSTQGYAYRYSVDGGSTWSSQIELGNPSGSFSLPSLMMGATYQVEMKAGSWFGVSGWSAPVSFTIGSVPGAVSGLTVVDSVNGLTVDFTPVPQSDHITGYEYRVKAIGAADFAAAVMGGTSAPITLSGLTSGTTYEVQVRAVNGIGDGPWSSSVSATASSQPSAPTATLGAQSSDRTTRSVTITPGASSGGSAITSYGFVKPDDSVYMTSSSATFDLALPPSGTTLILRPFVTNASGVRSVYGDPITLGVQATAPGIPGLDASYNPMTGVLSWTIMPSADNGGAAYSGYEIEFMSEGNTYGVDVVGDLRTGTVSFTGSAYPVVRVRAMNMAGLWSPWSMNYIVPLPMAIFNVNGTTADMQEECDDSMNPAQCMMTAMMAMGMHQNDGTMMDGCEMVLGSDSMMMCSINASMSMTASMMEDDMGDFMNVTIPNTDPATIPSNSTAGAGGGTSPQIPAMPMGMLPDGILPNP
jgi:titin